MDLDDELRRLFSDDRLDLRAQPGAGEQIVTGARRIRRRRHVIGSALAAVTVVGCGIALSNVGGAHTLPPAMSGPVPTSTVVEVVTSTLPPSIVTETHTMTVTVNQTAPATVPEKVNGPVGYGKLRLGMSEKDALATGVLIQPSNVAKDGCDGYRSESVPNDEAAVVISPEHGVGRISLPGFAKTAGGIGAGSTVAEVKAKYPSAAPLGSSFTVDMPGERQWRYVFLIGDEEKVSVVRMEQKNVGCALT